MEVVFIGTGVGVPSLKRASPGLIVRIEDENLLFDSGPGTLRKMLEAGFTYQDVSRIFYTHFHVDHIADLAPFLFAAKYPLSLREEELSITGPKGFKQFYDRLVQLYGSQILSEHYTLAIKEMENGEIKGKGWKITAAPVPHTEESIGYRIEDSEGRVLVYAGDCDYSAGLVELSRDAQVLILECSFPDKVQGHLSPGLAAKVASEADAQKLVLAHLYPVCEQEEILTPCEQEFSGEVIIAHDLLRLEV